MPRTTRNSRAAQEDSLDNSAAGLLRRGGGRPSAASTASASLTSPVTSSHLSSSLSEAESYIARHVDGLVEQQPQPRQRSLRPRRAVAVSDDADVDEYTPPPPSFVHEEGDTRAEADQTGIEVDSLVDGTGSNGDEDDHSEADSLADADDAEVEARVLENLGWESIGADKELPIVDLARWKTISALHTTEGTDEYGVCPLSAHKPNTVTYLYMLAQTQ